jgi:hypothetical protein
MTSNVALILNVLKVRRHISKASKYSSACACTALNIHIFTCLLKAVIVKPLERSITGERLCKRPLLGNNASIVAHVSVGAATWRVLSHCLKIRVFAEPLPSNSVPAGFKIPAFSRHTTICKVHMYLQTYIYTVYTHIHSTGTFASELNQLSNPPWRRMGEWMCRSTYSWQRYLLEVSG